jgi:hypothetical protein
MQQQSEAPELAGGCEQGRAEPPSLKRGAVTGCESRMHAEWQRISGGLFTTCPKCDPRSVRGFSF